MDSEKEVKKEPVDDSFQGDGDIELLDYESNLLLDTIDDDTLFITARGLGVERLFLNHLIMYSDPKLLYLVLNTNTHDEAYFINKLKESGVTCSPKLVTADVNVKDRQALYLSGGVQFITSRILLVDLLTKNVPVENVSGILVYRAHQVLHSFQESFIIRLYREHKRGGFVKAFSDVPSSLSSLGQLQRVVDRLYVKKVAILPRFHEHVRGELDHATVVEWNVALPPILRRVQNAIHDLIKVCMRELKQCSYSTKLNQDESENTIGVYAYMTTSLEKQLSERRSFLSDKQSRLLGDLELLREFLRIAEDMDMATLHNRFKEIRGDSEFLENNSGWILSTTASRLFSDVDTMCGTSENNSFNPPPKWDVLIDILKEVKNMEITPDRVGEDGPSVLVFASNDAVCRQLADLIKHGKSFLEWSVRKDSTHVRQCEPKRDPIWDPDYTSLFLRTNVNREARDNMKSDVQKTQIVTARAQRKRRKVAEDLIGSTSGGKQTNIVQFGILQYKKRRSGQASTSIPEVVEVKEEPLDEDQVEPIVIKKIKDIEDVPLVISPLGEKYNTLRFLEEKKPTVVILYNSDLATIRQLEIFKALNDKLHFVVHQVQYSNSTEEERYLTSINNETKAFEAIVREKGTLLIPRHWDVTREEAPTLNISHRDGGGTRETEERPIVVVDMREFNSELPTILYKKGFDVMAVTLEIGDYVLSPGISVERKALDDLTQSLQSGRVFKQIEQMLVHYSNTFLLVESNRKFEAKIVNGGPFQGELTRNCRDIRALLCSLIRSYPKMKLLWSTSPENSAEYFAELKISRDQPDVEKAISLRSGEVNMERDIIITDTCSSESSNKKSKPNAFILRYLSNNLQGLAKGDITSIMLNTHVKNLKDLFTLNADRLHSAIGNHADNIYNIAHFDFSQS